ncbi:MAG: hypothetical protein M0R46_01255 [Candidatus Muirbacterium halophilum]|nr:hypothetical protein [Candidatus Muirbacterium halophilum]MCK9474522.1 hypothetical protein [Candidatus Muirbacterium halophilum]
MEAEKHKFKIYNDTLILTLEHTEDNSIDDYLWNIRKSLPDDYISYKTIGLDFIYTEYVNSNMIGAYIAVFKEIKRLKKEFIFLNVSNELKTIFTLIHIDEHIKMYDFNQSEKIYNTLRENR